MTCATIVTAVSVGGATFRAPKIVPIVRISMSSSAGPARMSRMRSIRFAMARAVAQRSPELSLDVLPMRRMRNQIGTQAHVVVYNIVAYMRANRK